MSIHQKSVNNRKKRLDPLMKNPVCVIYQTDIVTQIGTDV